MAGASLFINAILAAMAIVLSRTHWLAVPYAIVLPALLILNLTWNLFFDPAKRSRTAYLLTTHRVVSLTDFITRTVRSSDLLAIKETTLRLHRDGTGTIIFDQSSWPRWPYWSSLDPDYRHAIAFEFISNPRQVRSMILDARGDSSPMRSTGAA